jgi:hypothetical protein
MRVAHSVCRCAIMSAWPVRVACPRGLGRAHRASELPPSLPSDRLDGTEVSWFVHAGSTCAGSMSSGEVGTAVGTAL